MPASAAGALALELLLKIEEIRRKSPYIQGRLSGQLKRNAQKISEIVVSLVSKAETAHDPLLLQKKNRDLIQQVSVMKVIQEGNKRKLEEATSYIEKLRTYKIPSGPADRGFNMEGRTEDLMEVNIEDETTQTNKVDNDVVWRPLIRGIFHPIPLHEKAKVLEDKDGRIRELQRQIDELGDVRYKLRKTPSARTSLTKMWRRRKLEKQNKRETKRKRVGYVVALVKTGNRIESCRRISAG